MYANRLAERILAAGDVLRVRLGRLGVTAADDARRFQAALDRSLKRNAPVSVRLSPNCLITVIPLARNGPLPQLLASPRLMLLINLDRRRALTGYQLLQLFDFTAAEARVARALIHGSTAEAYAEENGVSIATVRSQIRSVLTKTGMRRQSDLIRILGAVPAARSAGSTEDPLA